MRAAKAPKRPVESLRAAARKMMAEQRNSLFRALCKREGLPAPVEEYAFAKPERAWRFDFCWVEQRVALEVEGGVWTQGRHSRGTGMIEDMAKYNRGAAMGWRIFRVVPQQLDTLATVHMMRDALADPSFRTPEHG
jgi:hypothetical protein